MELAFDTKPLRDICESEQKAKQELGAKVAAQLKRRLADLQAAASIEDLSVIRPRKTSNRCIFDLTEGCRLVVAANHPTNPTLKSGKLDWANVTRIKIIGIERDHE